MKTSAAPHALVLLAFCAALTWSAWPRQVRAGDYHDGLNLDCGECHVMHRQQPKPEANGPARLDPTLAGPLLKADVNELCLSCHDGSQRAVDVLGANHGEFPSDVRQAGHLNRLGRTGQPASGHTLDSLETAPGSSPPWSADMENGSGRGLNCINCHAPHGRQELRPAYRNLRSDAGNNELGQGLVTYNGERLGMNDLTRDVFVRQARRYDESAVDFNEPDRADSAMARFCAGCHDRFHGVAGADADIGGHARGAGLVGFVRHPAAGVNIGAVGGSWSRSELFFAKGNRVKVMSELGSWQGGSDLTPTCITCHKAHGNDNAFGLIFRSGHGTPTEEGDTGGASVEALCGQCHEPGAP